MTNELEREEVLLLLPPSSPFCSSVSRAEDLARVCAGAEEEEDATETMVMGAMEEEEEDAAASVGWNSVVKPAAASCVGFVRALRDTLARLA